MNNIARGRSAYSTISVNDDSSNNNNNNNNEEDQNVQQQQQRHNNSTSENGENVTTTTTATAGNRNNNSVSNILGRTRRSTYQRVAADDAAAEDTDNQQQQNSIPAVTTKNNGPSQAATDDSNNVGVVLDPLTAALQEQENHIQITILDSAQAKFRISVNPDWSILELKQKGEAVHKVPPPSQRLIFRGKLLTDEKTLQDFGIVDNDVIIHLFPKPKVVVASSSSISDSQQQNGSQQQQHNPSDSGGGGGAHIPRIVLDPREAEQRSSILVLGSEEVVEAQNNVKLFSFMLLIICSMQLLALFTLMLGDPDDPGMPMQPHAHNHTPPTTLFDDAIDPNAPYSYGATDYDDMELRTWQNTDYIDLIISSVGFYVATLGIKATTENTLALARSYLIGTFIVGVAWNAFYFFLNVQAEEKIAKDASEVLPMGDLLTQALFAILLPCAVWILCCLRALQFHNLLQEAEQEATERIRAELDLEQGGGGGTTTTTTTTTIGSASNDNLSLALHNRAIFI